MDFFSRTREISPIRLQIAGEVRAKKVGKSMRGRERASEWSQHRSGVVAVVFPSNQLSAHGSQGHPGSTGNSLMKTFYRLPQEMLLAPRGKYMRAPKPGGQGKWEGHFLLSFFLLFSFSCFRQMWVDNFGVCLTVRCWNNGIIRVFRWILE